MEFDIIANAVTLGYLGIILNLEFFSVAGPTVWNSLSDDLYDPPVNSEYFPWDVKTHLTGRYGGTRRKHTYDTYTLFSDNVPCAYGTRTFFCRTLTSLRDDENNKLCVSYLQRKFTKVSTECVNDSFIFTVRVQYA